MPGASGNFKPFGALAVAEMRCTQRWLDLREPEEDVGAIILQQPEGEKLGYFSVRAATDAALTMREVAVVGYPADQQNGMKQFASSGTISRVNSKFVRYSVDTFQGQSGAPVFTVTRNVAEAVAIHAYEDSSLKLNVGVRLTEDWIELIKSWL